MPPQKELVIGSCVERRRLKLRHKWDVRQERTGQEGVKEEEDKRRLNEQKVSTVRDPMVVLYWAITTLVSDYFTMKDLISAVVFFLLYRTQRPTHALLYPHSKITVFPSNPQFFLRVSKPGSSQDSVRKSR